MEYTEMVIGYDGSPPSCADADFFLLQETHSSNPAHSTAHSTVRCTMTNFGKEMVWVMLLLLKQRDFLSV